MIASLCFSVLLIYCDLSQVGWFTSDGAAVNRTTLRMLEKNLVAKTGWMARDYDMM